MKYLLDFLFRLFIAYIFSVGAICIINSNRVVSIICYFIGFILIDGYIAWHNKNKNDKYS